MPTSAACHPLPYAPHVPSATTTLRGEPTSVPAARRWTVTTLTAWGLADTGWTAAQVVSELATNCTLHAHSEFTLRLTVEDESVRIEAIDGSPAGLQARSYSATSTTGRGLRIVESLAQDWGVSPEGDGKAVWAVLAIEDAERVTLDDDGPGAVRRPSGTAGAAPAGTVAFALGSPSLDISALGAAA